MKLIYQTANPRKKVAKKATSKKATRRTTKRKNPTEVTYTKEGGGRQTATLYSGQERAQMIKGKYALTQAQKKILSKKVGGTGRAANLVNKKKQSLSKSMDAKIAKFTRELKNATGARKKELELKLQGFKPAYQKKSALHGDLTEATAKRIAASMEKAARSISDKGVKALADKIKKGKKISRANKATAKASARSAQATKLREQLANSKKREQELTKLLSMGASDKDKADLIDIKREMKELKKELSNSKGVGMAKKAKKVATKKRKKAKTVKVAKKAKKKVASKKTATKKRAKRTKRSKAKGIVALAKAPKRRKTRRKTSKVVVKATTKKKTSKRRGAKKGSRKTKRNPYVMSNPYIKTNPMFTKIDSILDRALGVSTVELGGVVLGAALGGKLTEYAKKIPLVGEQIAKIPAQYQVTAIQGLLGTLAVVAETFMAKKKMKSSQYVGDIGRGFLLNALIGGVKTLSPMAVDATPMAGYVTDSTPRGMSGYVLDNGMAGGLALSDSDFKGTGADFDGSTIGGADFDGSTIGSMNDSVSDNFDFDSNPNW